MNLINEFFQDENKPCENKSEESLQNFLAKIKSILYYKKFLEHFGNLSNLSYTYKLTRVNKNNKL